MSQAERGDVVHVHGLAQPIGQGEKRFRQVRIERDPGQGIDGGRIVPLPAGLHLAPLRKGAILECEV